MSLHLTTSHFLPPCSPLSTLLYFLSSSLQLSLFSPFLQPLQPILFFSFSLPLPQSSSFLPFLSLLITSPVQFFCLPFSTSASLFTSTSPSFSLYIYIFSLLTPQAPFLYIVSPSPIYVFSYPFPISLLPQLLPSLFPSPFFSFPFKTPLPLSLFSSSFTLPRRHLPSPLPSLPVPPRRHSFPFPPPCHLLPFPSKHHLPSPLTISSPSPCTTSPVISLAFVATKGGRCVHAGVLRARQTTLATWAYLHTRVSERRVIG